MRKLLCLLLLLLVTPLWGEVQRRDIWLEEAPYYLSGTKYEVVISYKGNDTYDAFVKYVEEKQTGNLIATL